MNFERNECLYHELCTGGPNRQASYATVDARIYIALRLKDCSLR